MKLAVVAVALLCGACSFSRSALSSDAPPLADLEEPLELQAEPRDEDARRALPAGSFTGLVAQDARRTLDALLGESGGIEVASVVENSPADVAGVLVGDLVVEVVVEGRPSAPRWPSEWREIELAAAPGTPIELVVDRAGSEQRLKLVTIARARPAEREAAQRFREESRVGLVVRTATEVEARAAGLAPGGGAVVVGLARTSPWRAAGVRFGDLVRAVDAAPVGDPEMLLEAVRKANPGDEVELEIVRDGERLRVDAPVTSREHEVKRISIPLFFSYESERGATEWSVLFGLLARESTKSSWRWRVLWLLSFEGGEADHLEVEGS